MASIDFTEKEQLKIYKHALKYYEDKLNNQLNKETIERKLSIYELTMMTNWSDKVAKYMNFIGKLSGNIHNLINY